MTDKEAVEVLEDMKVKIDIPKAAELQRKRNDALDMAISALRAQSLVNGSQGLVNALVNDVPGIYVGDMVYRQDAISMVHMSLFPKIGLAKKVEGSLMQLPSAEPTVLQGTYDQVKWERDVAIKQLKELGYSLGEKPRTDAEPERRDCGWTGIEDDYPVSIREVIDITAETGALYTQNRVRELKPYRLTEHKTGRWIRLDYCTLHCNLCGTTFMLMQGISKMNYCPNCGEKMEVET